jgi:hypothetical protein
MRNLAVDSAFRALYESGSRFFWTVKVKKRLMVQKRRDRWKPQLKLVIPRCAVSERAFLLCSSLEQGIEMRLRTGYFYQKYLASQNWNNLSGMRAKINQLTVLFIISLIVLRLCCFNRCGRKIPINYDFTLVEYLHFCDFTWATRDPRPQLLFSTPWGKCFHKRGARFLHNFLCTRIQNTPILRSLGTVL